MAKQVAPVSYLVARTATVVITVVVWSLILFVLGAVFGRMLAGPDVSARALSAVLLIAVTLVPYFTAQGVLTGMVDGYQQGRFRAPSALRSIAPTSSQNPWGVGIVLLGTIGVPCAIVAASAAYRTYSELGSVNQSGFTWWLVGAGASTALLTALVASGAPFVREVKAFAHGDVYRGSLARYVWLRHVAPQAGVNLLINGWVAVALVSGRGMRADLELVVGDAVVASWIIVLSTVFGARNHARTDARGGLIADAPGAPVASRLRQALFGVGAGFVAGAFSWLVLSVLGRDSFSLLEFVAFKGSCAGLAAAAAAFAGARAGVREGMLSRVVRTVQPASEPPGMLADPAALLSASGAYDIDG